MFVSFFLYFFFSPLNNIFGCDLWLFILEPFHYLLGSEIEKMK